MHCDVVRPVVLPNRPGSHKPVHDAVVKPAVAPYCPTLQLAQVVADVLYDPAAQDITAVALVDPAAHRYPVAHGPEQAAVVMPLTFPNRPAGHGAVHDAAVSPVALPYEPIAHGPEQVEVDKPTTAPNVPTGQGPVHAADVRPAVAPYRPAPHALHAAAPAPLYWPVGHWNAVAFVEPAAQA